MRFYRRKRKKRQILYKILTDVQMRIFYGFQNIREVIVGNIQCDYYNKRWNT